MRIVMKIIIFFLLIQSVALAATFRPFATRDGTIALLLEGEIQPDDGIQLKRLLNAAAQKELRVSLLMLNSSGGKLDGGYALASIVQGAGIKTYVPEGAICASACFLPFVAGSVRLAAPNAQLGVHSASEGDLETELAKANTVDMTRVYKRYGVPSHIIGKAVTTPPGETSWLTVEELKYMGVSFVSASNENDRDYFYGITPTEGPRRNNNNTATIKDKNKARSLNKEAIKLTRQKRFSEAIEKLVDAAKIYPFDAEILGNLGWAQYLNGNFVIARDTLALALELNPKRWASWQNLGLALSKSGDVEWATNCFMKYYEYSTDKKLAERMLYSWMNGTNESLRKAASITIHQLGI